MGTRTVCLLVLCLLAVAFGDDVTSYDLVYVRDFFETTYIRYSPYKSYITGVEITTVSYAEATYNIGNGAANSDEACLVVGLAPSCPKAVNDTLPVIIFGVQVFYFSIPLVAEDSESSAACEQDSVQCPSGQWVSRQPPTCNFVCDDGTLYRLMPYYEAQQVLGDFLGYYSDASPYLQYFQGAMISTLTNLNSTLQSGRDTAPPPDKWDWDYYCIVAILNDVPPADVQFPSVFNGISVYYTVSDPDTYLYSLWFVVSILMVLLGVLMVVISMCTFCRAIRNKESNDAVADEEKHPLRSIEFEPFFSDPPADPVPSDSQQVANSEWPVLSAADGPVMMTVPHPHYPGVQMPMVVNPDGSSYIIPIPMAWVPTQYPEGFDAQPQQW